MSPSGTRIGPSLRVRFEVAHKFRRGDTRRSQRSRGAALAVACALLVAAGCGEESVGEGATVTVYASAPSCIGAKRELAREGGRAGDVRVRVVCLEDSEGGGSIDLAAIGASARRASEDSTTVAYIAEPDPAASRFSRPILEAAGIAQLTGFHGAAAMSRLLRAIRQADDSSSLRESVRDDLQ